MMGATANAAHVRHGEAKKVDPKQCGDLLLCDARLLNGSCGQAEISEQIQDSSEGRDHRDEPEIFGMRGDGPGSSGTLREQSDSPPGRRSSRNHRGRSCP